MDEPTADEMEWMAMEEEGPSPEGWEQESIEEEVEVSEKCVSPQPEETLLAKGTVPGTRSRPFGGLRSLPKRSHLRPETPPEKSSQEKPDTVGHSPEIGAPHSLEPSGNFRGRHLAAEEPSPDELEAMAMDEPFSHLDDIDDFEELPEPSRRPPVDPPRGADSSHKKNASRPSKNSSQKDPPISAPSSQPPHLSPPTSATFSENLPPADDQPSQPPPPPYIEPRVCKRAVDVQGAFYFVTKGDKRVYTKFRDEDWALTRGVANGGRPNGMLRVPWPVNRVISIR